MSLSSLHTLRHLVEAQQIGELEKFFNESVQLRQIGASVDLQDLARPKVHIRQVTEAHRGGIGSAAVNGGVISMLCDLAIGLLGLPHYREGMTATAHLTIHFLKPLVAERVLFVAETTDVVYNRVYGKVTVTNEKDEVAAYATGALAKGIQLKP